MVSVLIYENKLSKAGAGSDFNFRRRAGAFDRVARFIRRAFGFKFLFELLHEAEHRPGAGLAEGADRPALNVLGDVDQVIGVLRPAAAVREAMQRLGQPKRALAAGRALATALVRVKLSDVRQ